jgi:hypothetical protein
LSARSRLSFYNSPPDRPIAASAHITGLTHSTIRCLARRCSASSSLHFSRRSRIEHSPSEPPLYFAARLRGFGRRVATAGSIHQLSRFRAALPSLFTKMSPEA